MAEHHDIGKGHIENQTTDVADHDHFRSSDTREIGRQADFGQSHDNSQHQNLVVGALQFHLYRVVIHGRENI